MIEKLAIFGIGLIGGSVALALRRAGAVKTIVGVGRNRENLDAALALKVIDQATTDAATAVKGADVVLIAVPVGQTAAVMGRIAPHLEPHTVVTDAGSTKQDAIAAAARHLGGHFPRFVPAHPIAGAEQSGVQAAREDLFRDRNLILTPVPQTAATALRVVGELWQACGARVREMQPEHHDAVFAAVSHLPHLLAFTLVDEIAGRPNADELFGYAAGGFRDFTRIAGSSPEMWRDVCLANREAILRELDAYVRHLSRLRVLVGQGDGPALEEMFRCARRARRQWLAEN